jgi:hypothetical protein
MSYPVAFAGVAVPFIAILALLEVGRRIGARDYAKHPVNADKGFGALGSAIFGLMGLLLGFTFSGAGTRFDARRHLIADETNAIETAYLRLDLLPTGEQPKLRNSFREYLDSRLAFYKSFPDDPAGARAAQDRTTSLQSQIWSEAVEATFQAGSQANSNAVTSLVIQAINEMTDITTTRTAVLQIHPPMPIYAMLIALVLVCSLLAGYETASRTARSWVHVLGFSAILAVAVLLILDYEYPRTGLMRIDPADQMLVDLRNKVR